jgi:DNA-binding transcriptional ArsR family regulator
VKISDLTGDQLLQVLATLANPHRLRVVAALAAERTYVSQLARELDISRALLQVHLRKLQAAGLVSADIEVSQDGKAMKFYNVTPFALQLTPQTITAAARTLHAKNDLDAEARR